MPKRNLSLNPGPKLFEPSVSRRTATPSNSPEISLSSVRDTNILSTGSFRFDSPGAGIRSTQEIPLDYTKFENHTFFNSAESKVNIAFDRIINEFPFDGTRKELEQFQDSLTGFEKHVFDRFPKNVGFLMFSGSSHDPQGTHGTFMEVVDAAGVRFPSFSRLNTGESVLSVGDSSFSIETHLFSAMTGSGNQVICQHVSSSTPHPTSLSTTSSFGFVLALSASNLSGTSHPTTASQANTVDLIFAVTSGTVKLATSASIDKGRWNHICAVYDRRGSVGKIKLFLSQTLVASSTNVGFMGPISISDQNFLIGSGTSITVDKSILPGAEKDYFVPTQTLSGALDEFRFFHNVRRPENQRSERLRNIFAQKPLKLYFRFNEPFYTGSYGARDVVLDSSGYSLHTPISNFTSSMRLTGSLPVPMTAEDKSLSPILFPGFSKVANLNSTLLSTASNYDRENPNLITRLLPVHYLIEGQIDEGLERASEPAGGPDGQLGQPFTANSIPGSGEIGSSQLLTAFLLIWAKFFDELKITIDHFSKVIHVDYDDDEAVAEKLLPFVAKYYGFSLPSLYSNASLGQFLRGENIKNLESLSDNSLQHVQNQIWKRILINLKESRQSKGTIHSIRSLMAAAGINVDSLFTIREYGGPSRRTLQDLRQKRSEVSTMLDFSGSFGHNPLTLTSSHRGFGYLSSGSFATPHVISQFLSSSRLESGFPAPKGTMVNKASGYGRSATGKLIHGISTDHGDGFFTSGSFTYEGIYKFPSQGGGYPLTQSLVRIHTTGTSTPAAGSGLVLANVIILSGAQNSVTSSGSEIKLFVKPSIQTTSEPHLELSLTGVNIFDGNKWYLSFGRNRCDEIGLPSSSSYFLRCARQSYGGIAEIFSTSSLFQEASNGSPLGNLFQATGAIANSFNRSGPFLVIGSQSITPSPSNSYCLNSGTDDKSGKYDIQNLHTEFNGKMGHIKFYSKGLSGAEFREHARNFKSLGVNDPRANFNFVTAPTGAFERLRLDVSTDQAITGSNTKGNIVLHDFSQNDLFFSGSGFEISKSVVRPETFNYSILSPKFDIAQSDQKVRIRSFQDQDLVDESAYAVPAPMYEIQPSEKPDDDNRFSIDFSAIRSLDEDIMNMFSSLDFFDSALGSPNLLFDDFYPDLEHLSDIYFNRLTRKLDIASYFDFFKWFDSSFSVLIEQLIPRKTNFLGVNFVIESHVLERNRFRYLFDDIYLQGFERDIDVKGARIIEISGDLNSN